MEIRGIETHQTAIHSYNMSMPIGILFSDEDNYLKKRIEEAKDKGEKIYLCSPNDERMIAAKRLIEEMKCLKT